MAIEKISPVFPIYQSQNRKEPQTSDQQPNKKQKEKGDFKDEIEKALSKFDVKI